MPVAVGCQRDTLAWRAFELVIVAGRWRWWWRGRRRWWWRNTAYPPSAAAAGSSRAVVGDHAAEAEGDGGVPFSTHDLDLKIVFSACYCALGGVRPSGARDVFYADHP